MYKILVVDDEPRVSAGLRNVLLHSDLEIASVETASNGFEAIDYLRMEQFDLMLTDIQMSRMSGIELMETIYLEQPHLPVIVISAHEKFDFAKKSLRLGARDYLVKPVELDELIRVVSRTLNEKREAGRKALELCIGDETARVEAGPVKRRNEALIELITEKELLAKDYDELVRELGSHLNGGSYGIVSIHLDLSQGGFSEKEIRLKDRKLLKYAVRNIVEECLAEWHGLIVNGFGSQLIGVIQMQRGDLQDAETQMKSQLHLIAQTLYMNLQQYLNINATIGASTLSSEVGRLPHLLEEAISAAEWRKSQPNQHTFFYEDVLALDKTQMVNWGALVDELLQHIKTQQDTEASINPMLEMLIAKLNGAHTMFTSYFGLLVYRLYGLLLEYAIDRNLPLHRMDPEVYFRGMVNEAKLEALPDYVEEIATKVRQCLLERDQSIISHVLTYIHHNFHNRELKIQEIAAEVHFSPTYVSLLFKKERDQTLWDYVTEIRIEEAKRLLANSDLKRYEIAYRVGYESPEHFSRIFKRYTGISPADYKKASQGGSD